MPAPIMQAAWIMITIGGILKKMLAVRAAPIMRIAIALYRGAMAPVAFQSAIIGPNVAWSSSRFCSLGDPFPNANAARITNGVVGNTGKTTPIAPSPSDTQPASNHKPWNRVFLEEPKIRATG